MPWPVHCTPYHVYVYLHIVYESSINKINLSKWPAHDCFERGLTKATWFLPLVDVIEMFPWLTCGVVSNCIHSLNMLWILASIRRIYRHGHMYYNLLMYTFPKQIYPPTLILSNECSLPTSRIKRDLQPLHSSHYPHNKGMVAAGDLREVN